MEFNENEKKKEKYSNLYNQVKVLINQVCRS